MVQIWMFGSTPKDRGVDCIETKTIFHSNLPCTHQRPIQIPHVSPWTMVQAPLGAPLEVIHAEVCQLENHLVKLPAERPTEEKNAADEPRKTPG